MCFYKVNSSCILSFARTGADLYIEFKSGHIYHYFGVSDEEFKDFAQASSKGQWFNNHILNVKSFNQADNIDKYYFEF